MVVGHEFCGEIVDTGPAANKFQVGQRVSGEGHIICRNRRAGRGHLFGIMGALVAQSIVARKVVITDLSPYRIELAKKMGVQHVVHAANDDLSEVMAEIGMTEGFDVGLEMSGAAPAMRNMIDKMNNGGKIALLGIAPTEFAVDWNKIIFKMLHVKGIYGREIFETWHKMIALVQSGLDLTELITHRIPIEDYEQGFRATASGEAGKVVMDCT